MLRYRPSARGIVATAIAVLLGSFATGGDRSRADAAEGAEPERPNIIFVFTDDHAQHAISAYGSEINETPNLDRLADEGMLFRNVFVTNSICSPSRAVLLTGKHSHHNGVLTNRETFDSSQQTLPKLLREAGYNTAMIGKWHLKSEPTGFDYWRVLPGQGHYYNPDFRTPDGTTQLHGYVTDIITDLSLEWLESGRDPDKPFLLMYHHKAPHREWEPGPDHLTLYDDTEIPEPATLFDDYEGRSPAASMQEMEIARHLNKSDLKLPPGPDDPEHLHNVWARTYGRMDEQQRAAWDAAYDPKNEAFYESDLEGDDLVRWKYQRYIKDYLRTIASVDDNMGRLLDYLEQSGLDENTIVIYASDQGFYLGDHGWYDKRWIYEQSLRTPLMVRWPESVRPGSVNEDMVSNLDWAPTMLDMAGVDVPDDMQGRSLAPLLRGESVDDWRDSVYYHYYEFPAVHMVNRHYGVRTERYKLAHFYELDAWELYDLQEDPHELNSVYDDPDYAEIRERLQQELARLQEHYGEDDPEASIAEIAQQRWRGRLAETRLEEVVSYERGEAQQRSDLDPSTKTFTVGAVAAPDGDEEDGVLVSQGGASLGYSLYLDEGVPTFAIRSSGELREVAAAEAVAAGEAVHLAGVFDEQSRMHLYVDGERVASGPGLIITSKPLNAFNVGSNEGSPVADYEPPNRFEGELRDIRLYWGVLDDDAIRAWARGR